MESAYLLDEARRLASEWEADAARARKAASYKALEPRTREYVSTLEQCAAQLRFIVGR